VHVLWTLLRERLILVSGDEKEFDLQSSELSARRSAGVYRKWGLKTAGKTAVGCFGIISGTAGRHGIRFLFRVQNLI
jgi:hypothetical protein